MRSFHPGRSYLLALLAVAASSATVLAQTPDPAVEHHPGTVLRRIAYGSCAKESRPQPIWARVLAATPDLWIWAGDNVYGDTEDMEELRGKYAQLAAIPGYAALREQVPVLGIWDDHDFGENDAGVGFPRKQQSQQMLLDFLGVPPDSPRRQREGVYHAATYGPEGRRVQVILLDTRYHRSPLEEFDADGTRQQVYRPTRDRAATVLGAAQWRWLEDRLREPADLRLIVSSIQFVAEEQRFEKWANFPLERERMLGLLRATNAEGVVFLSGDRHHAELSRLPRSDGYPLFDLTSSGINQSFGPRPGRPYRIPENNAWRVGDVFKGPHFGMVEIDWDQPDPVVSLRAVGLDTVPLEHDLTLGALRNSTAAGRLWGAFADSSRSDTEPHVVDGDPDEWQSTGTLEVDDRHLHGRFTAIQARSLTAGTVATRIHLDLDGDDRTGADRDGLGGTDLTITWNPVPTGATRGRRRPWEPVLVRHLGPDRDVAVGAEALGLQLQPTCAARHFEFRLDRRASPWLGELVGGAGTVELLVVRVAHQDGAVMELTRGRAEAPAAPEAPAGSATAPPPVPARASDRLRVASWNVLWATPQRDPADHAAVLRVLAPDVVLIQEWDQTRYSAHEITSWFTEHVDAGADWQAMVTGTGGYGQGTAVVSRHPITARAPAAIPVEDGRWNFPVRCAAAVVDTPLGQVLASSLHLKAGGSLDSPEDTRRLAEARAVNAVLRGMVAVARPDLVVVGGDFNLNGTSHVLELTGRGLDLDGSLLAVAQPRQLGDPQLTYTFGRGPLKARFDYLMFSDINAEVTAAFGFDTRLLPQPTLQELALRPDAAHASDHFPVVVDLRIRSRRTR